MIEGNGANVAGEATCRSRPNHRSGGAAGGWCDGAARVVQHLANRRPDTLARRRSKRPARGNCTTTPQSPRSARHRSEGDDRPARPVPIGERRSGAGCHLLLEGPTIASAFFTVVTRPIESFRPRSPAGSPERVGDSLRGGFHLLCRCGPAGRGDCPRRQDQARPCGCGRAEQPWLAHHSRRGTTA